MIVAIHQPNYFPWLGYFHKVLHSDVFVLLDHVQYSKSSYTSRVQILCKGTPHWMSIPVVTSGRLGQSIREASSDPRAKWNGKHLNMLRANYARHPYFGEVFGRVEALLAEVEGDVAALNSKIIRALAAEMGARCRFVESSSLDLPDIESSELLVAIVGAVEGTSYVHGAGGRNYQDADAFSAAGIELRDQRFAHPTYPQHRCSDFIAGLSILDCLFNVGLGGCGELLRA